MAEPHVIDALRGKRSELSGIVSHLEQQIVHHRASLVHLDAAMRLFDPDLVPEAIRSRQHRPRSVWFRPGECLRLIHDVLRDALQAVTTRASVVHGSGGGADALGDVGDRPPNSGCPFCRSS